MSSTEEREAEAVLAALASPPRQLRYAVDAPTVAMAQRWWQQHGTTVARGEICIDPVHLMGLGDLTAVVIVNEAMMQGHWQLRLAREARMLALACGIPVIEGQA